MGRLGETWAHYLHIADALGTARNFGLEAHHEDIRYEPFTAQALCKAEPGPGDLAFLELVNAWIELTGALNEITRSMGQPDFYPFVLSAPAVRKLHFVHEVVQQAAAGGCGLGGSPTGAGGLGPGEGSSTGAGGGDIGGACGGAGGSVAGQPGSGTTGTSPSSDTGTGQGDAVIA